jgi:hypothetical protein
MNKNVLFFIIWNFIMVGLVVFSFIYGEYQQYTISILITTFGASLSFLTKKRSNVFKNDVSFTMKIFFIILNSSAITFLVFTTIYSHEYWLLSAIILPLTGLITIFYFLKKPGRLVENK